jgi:hypothetical protein
MVKQEFSITYFDERYLDFHFPDRKNTAHFQLAHGNPHGALGGEQYVVSRPRDFSELALAILHYLKQPGSLDHTYQVLFSEKASHQIGETGTQVLEQILALHNDLVTPRRR